MNARCMFWCVLFLGCKPTAPQQPIAPAPELPLEPIQAFSDNTQTESPEPASGVTFEVDPRPVDMDELTKREQLYDVAKQLVEKLQGNKPIDANDAQFLSILGRTDWINLESGSYVRKDCPPLSGTLPPLEAIAESAQSTSIVIVNEAHDQPLHRDFIAQVAERLAPLGYDTYAAETFSPRVSRQESVGYTHRDDGFYTREPVFGRSVRSIASLGYRLVSYEQRPEQMTQPQLPDLLERIHERERAQVENLMEAIFRQRPQVKVLLHVGYDHALKHAFRGTGGRMSRWMAARLWEATGIEPLTISQTTCRGAQHMTLADVSSDELAERRYDFYVDHPLVRFERGRPAWMLERGDIFQLAPKNLYPKQGWSLIEARLATAPDDAVPTDRILVAPGELVPLVLPPGHYRLRALKLL